MSDRAVMPLSDYVSACDKVREKAPRKTIAKNKTFYPTTDNNVTEIITKGTLKLGESYYVDYNNAAMVATSNIYEVRNIEVQGVLTKGIEMLLSHPAGDEYKVKICIYQDEENIMLYASEILDYEDYPTYITLEEITGEIVSGELAEKINEVYEAGKKAEYDSFWDAYQENGNRRDYSNAFYNKWNDETFKPKYDIIATSAYSACGYSNMSTINVVFDLSGASNTSSLFYSCHNLKTIKKIIVSEKNTISNWFTYCNSLEYVTFEGVIGQNGLDFQWSTNLSKASWMNIMSKLSPFTTGLSITGSLASVKKAFETSEGANDGDTSDAWLTLCGKRDNWTISLV